LTAQTIRNDLTPTQKEEAMRIATEIYRFKLLKRYGAQRQLFQSEFAEYNKLIGDHQSNITDILKYQEPVINVIIKLFQDIGYSVYYKVLNAVNFNVAQNRERVFIIGVKNHQIKNVFPAKNPKILSCKSILFDLENIGENELPNHVFTKHSLEMIEKIKKTPPGDSPFNYKEGWLRLIPDRPSNCVKENHGGVFIHYSLNRVLTPRELARLQSFPDDYVFLGTKGAILKGIGNSVPVNLAKALASKCVENFQLM